MTGNPAFRRLVEQRSPGKVIAVDNAAREAFTRTTDRDT